MADSDFTRQTVETIAKRAANRCSSPDCGALTCGPAEHPDRSLTIGEAAHIFGSRPGSARFRDTMTPSGRSDITNAIWLCRNCHKLVDSDPIQFSSEILFEWRRQHEENVTAQLGKPSEIIRRKMIMKHLERFSSCSYLAQQIVIDKPPHWEYKLTIELLRTRMGPVIERWKSLERGLYVKVSTAVPQEMVLDWLRVRFDEVNKLCAAFSELANTEMQAAWGPPGTPGSEDEILRVCDLFTECADRVLQWEETTRFAVLPYAFANVQSLLIGTAGQMLDQLARIPDELSAPFNAENPSGTVNIMLVLSLPDKWSDNYARALEEAFKNISG